MTPLRPNLWGLMVGLALTLIPATGHCSLVLDVTLDTTALQANSSGSPYSIDFTFIDGSGTNDGNNSVTISGISFGVGGSAGSTIGLMGGASGSLSTTVNLVDNTFFTDF